MDSPKDVVEVRRNDDGTLDEIVAGDPNGPGVFVHLEQMDANLWWIGISHKGYRQVVLLSADGQIRATSEMDDSPPPQTGS